MSKTQSEKIREALQNLGIASPREIMDWIKVHYPEEEVKASSYRAVIIGCSINHSSSHHYPSMPKFLWFIDESKQYRLATEQDPEYVKIIFPPPTLQSEPSEKIEGVHVSELSPTSKLHIPSEIRDLLNIRSGEKVGFIISEDGSIVLKKAKLKLTFE